MKEHELKILPQYFKEVVSGNKSFEIRKNDREFKVGDTLLLKELKACTNRINDVLTETTIKGYTGQEITKEVAYILEGGQYGLEEGYCILGLKPVGYQDILNKLMEYGLNAEEVQKAYERYIWNINYHKDSIKLKNIDLTGISKLEQYKKILEEQDEFDASFNDYLKNKNEENKNHVIEEFFDVIQATLGTLEKNGISAQEVMASYPLHEKKLLNRPRCKKCDNCKNGMTDIKRFVGDNATQSDSYCKKNEDIYNHSTEKNTTCSKWEE